MIYEIPLENLIILFTIGALLITAIYHGNLFFFNRTRLLGSYSLYLSASFAYLLFVGITNTGKLSVVATPLYAVKAFVFWISVVLYFKFFASAFEHTRFKSNYAFKLANKMWLATPFFVISASPIRAFINASYLGSPELAITLMVVALILDFYLFGLLGYLIYIILKGQKTYYSWYLLAGTFSLIIFSMLHMVAYYTESYILGLPYASFSALGYFIEVSFFSMAIGVKMRNDIKLKYQTVAQLQKKQLELKLEKQKASEILISRNFEIETERTKAIIEQRTAIGRRLHDDLSGSLVALRFLVQDFITKAVNEADRDRFKDLEAEISSIYKETRNYSHELSKNAEFAYRKTSYDIGTYLQKLAQQFLSIELLTLHATFSTEQIRAKVNALQTKHIYFLLKECISNTIKHSSAKNIWINIEFVGKRCIIHFTDDGGGFDLTVNEGLGLKGMNESVEELGGAMNLTADKGNTNIYVEFEVV